MKIVRILSLKLLENDKKCMFKMCSLSIIFLIRSPTALLVACGLGNVQLFLHPRFMPVSSRSSCRPVVNLPWATLGGSFPVN